MLMLLVCYCNHDFLLLYHHWCTSSSISMSIGNLQSAIGEWQLTRVEESVPTNEKSATRNQQSLVMNSDQQFVVSS